MKKKQEKLYHTKSFSCIIKNKKNEIMQEISNVKLHNFYELLLEEKDHLYKARWAVGGWDMQGPRISQTFSHPYQWEAVQAFSVDRILWADGSHASGLHTGQTSLRWVRLALQHSETEKA